MKQIFIIEFMFLALACLAGKLHSRLLQGTRKLEDSCVCIALWAPVCDQTIGAEYPNRQCAESCYSAKPENLVDGPCIDLYCACIDEWDPVCDKTTGKEYTNSDCAVNCNLANADDLGPCRSAEEIFGNELSHKDEKLEEDLCVCISLWDPVCNMATGKQYSNSACAVGCEGAKAEDLGPCETVNTIQESEVPANKPCACQKILNPVCDTTTGKKYDNEQCAVDCHGADPDNLEPCSKPIKSGGDIRDGNIDAVCVSSPISCTYDLNKCGVSSSCQCLAGYRYDNRLGQCLLKDITYMERKPGPLALNFMSSLRNSCAVRVGKAAPCTVDINICGNARFCSCAFGHVYDPRTALCLKTLQ